MFWFMEQRISGRLQGDIGERSALSWLIEQNAKVYLPFGHSPDVDLVANLGDRLTRVQVKTTTVFRNKRWAVSLATRGGNQSWNGLVKYFDPTRCDHLFVLAADGRRWFIPSADVEARAGLVLGGPKYAAFEVEPDRPFCVALPA
jgi:hypothetical protein